MFQFNYDILTTSSRRRMCGEVRGQARLVDHGVLCAIGTAHGEADLPMAAGAVCEWSTESTASNH
eukprot:11898441-Heterocapsa_arctica.AAC.1